MRTRLLTVIATAFVLTACGGGGDSAEPDGGAGPTDDGATTAAAAGDAARGGELFANSCAGCHGTDGRGIEGLGKDLVASPFVAGTSDAELVAFVKQGRPSSDPDNTTGVDMPPKGGDPSLNDEDLLDIVAWIRSQS